MRLTGGATFDGLEQHTVCAVVVMVGNVTTVCAIESTARTKAVVELAASSACLGGIRLRLHEKDGGASLIVALVDRNIKAFHRKPIEEGDMAPAEELLSS